MSESIKTIWRFGYFKLFWEDGFERPQRQVSTNAGEWRQLFWRFYWREV